LIRERNPVRHGVEGGAIKVSRAATKRTKKR